MPRLLEHGGEGRNARSGPRADPSQCLYDDENDMRVFFVPEQVEERLNRLACAGADQSDGSDRGYPQIYDSTFHGRPARFLSKLPNRSPKRSPFFAFGIGHFLERSLIADPRQLWVA